MVVSQTIKAGEQACRGIQRIGNSAARLLVTREAGAAVRLAYARARVRRRVGKDARTREAFSGRRKKFTGGRRIGGEQRHRMCCCRRPGAQERRGRNFDHRLQSVIADGRSRNSNRRRAPIRCGFSTTDRATSRARFGSSKDPVRIELLAGGGSWGFWPSSFPGRANGVRAKRGPMKAPREPRSITHGG